MAQPWEVWLLRIAADGTNLAVLWLLHSTVVIAAGLAAGKLLARHGAALQSAVYRATLVVALVGPTMAAIAESAGVSLGILALPRLEATQLVAADDLDAPPPGDVSRSAQNGLSAIATGSPTGQRQADDLVSRASDDARTAEGGDELYLHEKLGLAGQGASGVRDAATGPMFAVTGDAEAPAALEHDVAPAAPAAAPVWSVRPLSAAVAAGTVLVWFAGTLVLGVRLVVAYWQSFRLGTAAIAVAPEEAALCRRWSRQLGVRAPQLRRTPFLSSPCLTGIVRPVILLPESIADRSLVAALIHELAHLRRRDCFWNLARHAAVAVLWFQPLAWRLSRRLEATAEEVCDDYVMRYGSDRTGYAELLVSLAEQAILPLSSAVVPLVTFRSFMAHRVGRILDTTRRLSLSVSLVSLSLIAAAGSAATLAAGLLGATTPHAAASSEEPAAVEVAAAEEQLTTATTAVADERDAEAAAAADSPRGVPLEGRVVDDATGQPLAGARLVVWLVPSFEEALAGGRGRVQLVGTSADDGRFSYELPTTATRGYLVAHREGLGIDWIEFDPQSPPQGEVALRLVADVPVRGRVLTAEGTPVAGAVVSCLGIHVPPATLDVFLAAWKKNGHDAMSALRKRIYGHALTGVVGPVTTDDEGHFVIEGVGADRLARLKVETDGMAHEATQVVTRADLDLRAINDAALAREPFGMQHLGAAMQLNGPETILIVEPELVIEGIVRDAASGEPVEGCSLFTGVGYDDGVVALSDHEGRYRLAGVLKRNRGYIVSATAHDTSYLRRSVRVNELPALGNVTLDIDLYRGTVVTGRVVDKSTGQGVRAGIRFAPLADNTYFGRPGYDAYGSDRTMAGTDDQGRFRLVTIPGPSLVMVQVHAGVDLDGRPLCIYGRAIPSEGIRDLFQYDSSDDTWRIDTAGGSLEFIGNQNAVDRVEVPEEGELDIELFVDAHNQATLVIQDADGVPLQGTWVSGLADKWPLAYRVPEGQTTVYALRPERPRALVLYHPERGLGGVATVRGDETEPVVARLAPLGSIAGRLVDSSGRPLVGLEAYVYGATEIGRELYRFAPFPQPSVVTDADGRFQLESVVPGMSIYLGVRQGKQSFTGRPALGRLKVEPGEAVDLGERVVVPR